MVWSFRNMTYAVAILTITISSGFAQTAGSSGQAGSEQLWADLHHPVYETAEKAARTLLKANAGLEKTHWRAARLVPHADAKVRQQLARQLSSKPITTPDEGLVVLSHSAEPEIRKLVVLAAEDRKSSPELMARISEMAKIDPSPLVRGYAALLSSADDSIDQTKSAAKNLQETGVATLNDAVENTRKSVQQDVAAKVAETDQSAKMLIEETEATTQRVETTIAQTTDQAFQAFAAAEQTVAEFKPSLKEAESDANAWAAALANTPVGFTAKATPATSNVVQANSQVPQTPPAARTMSFSDFMDFGDSPTEDDDDASPASELPIQRTAGQVQPEATPDAQAIPLMLPVEQQFVPQTALIDDEPLSVPGTTVSETPVTAVPNPGAPPAGEDVEQPINPGVLDRPLDQIDQPLETLEPSDVFQEEPGTMLTLPFRATPGYSGKSGIRSTEFQENSHFVPVEDRWRLGQPQYDRYGKGHEKGSDDYLYVKGHWWDPYNQNVLKGDFPIVGQHTFLNIEAEALLINAYGQVPTPTTPFESTKDPNQEKFFGDPNAFLTTNFFGITLDLFHGSTSFKPFDWQVVANPVFNFNYLDTNELGLVNPDVREGTTRTDSFFALEQWFVELKLADTSPHYDFTSVRVGSQPFQSDFRGHIFSDINRGIRFFGTRNANRDQWNVAFFDQVEKDTNSLLNTFDDRPQRTIIANYYRQDFIWPGYTTNVSYHYNHERPSFLFDNNNFLARPDPTGVFKPHRVQAHYFGWTGEGHIDVINVSHAFYWALGHDGQNPIAGTSQDINAQLGAIELSIDRDWMKFRTSFFWASGDNDPNDGDATGFSTILDNPQFAGGEFSYWQRNRIGLFGGAISQQESLVPDLRTSKFQGQSNFVNPGLLLVNVGVDFEVTPKWRVITNANYLWFEEAQVLEAFTFQDDIDRRIGLDLSVGTEWRPRLNDNIVIEAAYSVLIPGQGFRDLYGNYDPFTLANSKNESLDSLHSAFVRTELIW